MCQESEEMSTLNCEVTPQCSLTVTSVKSLLFLVAKDVAHTTYPDAMTFVTREYLEVGGDQPGALWGDRIPEETVCGSKSGQLGEEGTEDTGVVMQGCSSPGRCHPCHWGL